MTDQDMTDQDMTDQDITDRDMTDQDTMTDEDIVVLELYCITCKTFIVSVWPLKIALEVDVLQSYARAMVSPAPVKTIHTHPHQQMTETKRKV